MSMVLAVAHLSEHLNEDGAQLIRFYTMPEEHQELIRRVNGFGFNGPNAKAPGVDELFKLVGGEEYVDNGPHFTTEERFTGGKDPDFASVFPLYVPAVDSPIHELCSFADN